MATDSSTPSPGLVTVEIGSDGVAVVTLANGKVNALSTAVLAELAAAARRLTDDPPGAVVITGGPKLFAAGADITEFAGPEEARTIGGAFRDALDAVAAIPRMVIAAVNGVALGGGCELALACDLRIASTKARFGQPEILLGIIPGGGGTQRLARLVGPAKAKDLICSGRQVRATEALELGLVDELVDPDDGDVDPVFDRAHELALSFANGALAAQALAKRAIDAGLDGSLADGLALEQDLFAEVFATDDAGIGVASFLEHGPGRATFTGR
jgi:enoyl-CoA hydratase